MKTTHPNYISIALYRLSMLAFVLCAASALALAAMGMALVQQQPTLVAVDDRGRLHGYIEYLRPEQRSEEEIRLAVHQFIRSYLSVGSETIVADMRLALTMMSPEMAEHEKRVLIESNRIATIQQARLSGLVSIDEIVIKRDHSDVISAETSGQIEIGQHRRPYRVRIEARIVPRTIHNTLGLRIESISDRHEPPASEPESE